MANFEVYAPFLLSWEGGFSNKKSDRGGATMCGITYGTWETYCRKHGLRASVQTLRSITKEQWKDITKTYYWDAVWGDLLRSQSVANALADWAFNSGVKTAVRKLQSVLPGLATDGVMGPKTLNRVNSENPVVVFKKLKDARQQYFLDIVKNDSRQGVNLKGWTNRLKNIRYGLLVCNDKAQSEIKWTEH